MFYFCLSLLILLNNQDFSFIFTTIPLMYDFGKQEVFDGLLVLLKTKDTSILSFEQINFLLLSKMLYS